MPRQRQPQPPDTDPRRLIPPVEFARMLGHQDTTTLSHWVKNPPAGFPEPDSWEQLPTRRRPLWRHDRAQAYATANPQVNVRRSHRGGRPAGSSNSVPRPDRDPRADEVARLLDLADAGERPAVTRAEIEQHYDVPDYTARRILARARARREQP